MDATKFAQPWLNVPMSGNNPADAQNQDKSWRPGSEDTTKSTNTENEPVFTYQPWVGSVMTGR